MHSIYKEEARFTRYLLVRESPLGSSSDRRCIIIHCYIEMCTMCTYNITYNIVARIKLLNICCTGLRSYFQGSRLALGAWCYSTQCYIAIIIKSSDWACVVLIRARHATCFVIHLSFSCCF